MGIPNGTHAPLPTGKIDITVTFHPNGTAQSALRFVDCLGGLETVLDILLLEMTKVRRQMKVEAEQRVKVAKSLPPELEG